MEKEEQFLKSAKKVQYCGVCKLPPEYCTFGSDKKDQCKEWCLINCPELYKQLYEGDGVEQISENLAETTLEEKNEKDNELKDDGDEEGSSKEGSADVNNDEEKPKSKSKAAATPKVQITRLQRNKKKWVTVVAGIENFNVTHKEACKLFANKFACGASVTKSTKGEVIDIQGDVKYDLVDLLQEKYDISEDDIEFMDDGKAPKKGKR